jgi:nucleoside-diphosphate-sugar epimerase
MANILIIGCGAIGTPLAHTLTAQGHTVTGLKRNPPTTASQINVVAADIASAVALATLATDFDTVFFIVSADGRSEQSYRAVYETGLQNVLAKFTRQPLIFVSSTSVYAQNQGEWVDEDSIAQPEAITSQLIRQAERRVMDANPHNMVVRFSGIYGRGREYLLRMAQQVPAIQQQPPYFTNRIHQDDCVGVLAFLLQQRLAGVVLQRCYLASDDDPAPQWEVMSWLAAQLHCPAPTAKTVPANADGNKRCDNRRLKNLGYQFRYPSYKNGYHALIAS